MIKMNGDLPNTVIKVIIDMDVDITVRNSDLSIVEIANISYKRDIINGY